MKPIALVVDDDNPSRMINAQILLLQGFEVYEAADGVQALNILNTITPVLVLLDLRLPRVSGEDVLSAIYANPHLNATHVIIVTAHEEFERSLALRSGDHYLVKPALPKQIRALTAPHLTSCSTA